MIASHVRNPRARFAAYCLPVAILIMVSRDKAPPTAPTGYTIPRFSNPTIAPLGGTAEITGQGCAAGNVPVHTGPGANLPAAVGTIDPAEAPTQVCSCSGRRTPGT